MGIRDLFRRKNIGRNPAEKNPKIKKPRTAVNNFSCGYHTKHSSIFRHLPLFLNGKTVLEVGCGNGGLAFLLASRVGKKGKVIACDPQKGIIALCRYKKKLLANSRNRGEYLKRLSDNLEPRWWGKEEGAAAGKQAIASNLEFANKRAEELETANSDATIARFVLNNYTQYNPRGITDFLSALERHTKKGGRIVLIDGKKFITPHNKLLLEERGYKQQFTLGNTAAFSKKKK